MTRRSIIISFIILVLVVLITYLIYRLHRPFVHILNPDLQMIAVIDSDNTHEINPHTILNGDDSILVVDHASFLYNDLMQKIPQATYLSPDELFNMNNIHLMDKNSDGMITESDPLFAHLFVIRFYDNGQQNDIKSAASAGIKAIIINNTTPSSEYQVLMGDGSHRTLYNISKFEKAE